MIHFPTYKWYTQENHHQNIRNKVYKERLKRKKNNHRNVYIDTEYEQEKIYECIETIKKTGNYRVDIGISAVYENKVLTVAIYF